MEEQLVNKVTNLEHCKKFLLADESRFIECKGCIIYSYPQQVTPEGLCLDRENRFAPF